MINIKMYLLEKKTLKMHNTPKMTIKLPKCIKYALNLKMAKYVILIFVFKFVKSK